MITLPYVVLKLDIQYPLGMLTKEHHEKLELVASFIHTELTDLLKKRLEEAGYTWDESGVETDSYSYSGNNEEELRDDWDTYGEVEDEDYDH